MNSCLPPPRAHHLSDPSTNPTVNITDPYINFQPIRPSPSTPSTTVPGPHISFKPSRPPPYSTTQLLRNGGATDKRDAKQQHNVSKRAPELAAKKGSGSPSHHSVKITVGLGGLIKRDQVNVSRDDGDINLKKSVKNGDRNGREWRMKSKMKMGRKIQSQPDLLTAAENELFSTLIENVHSLSTGTLNQGHDHESSPVKVDGGRGWSELARQADNCVACWNEAWKSIISDLDKSDKLDDNALEAVYLLRNAHKTGFFHSSDESTAPSSSDESMRIFPSSNDYKTTNGHELNTFSNAQNDSNTAYSNGRRSQTSYHGRISRRDSDITGNGDDAAPYMKGHSRSRSSSSGVVANMDPVYISRSMSESFSSDDRSSSVENLRSRDNRTHPSSGRSTPSFRKKPERPNIKIADHPVYKDFVEIRRTDSLTSLDSEMDRYSFVSDTSYIDILSDTNGRCTSNRSHCNGRGISTQEFEETLRDEPTQTMDADRYSNLIDMCRNRPDSPTSKLLLPILNSSSSDPMSILHQQLSPILNKLKTLEEQSDLVGSLQTKVALLEREKKQMSISIDELRSQPIINPFIPPHTCSKQTLTDVNASAPCRVDRSHVTSNSGVERLSDILSIPAVGCSDKETTTKGITPPTVAIETQTLATESRSNCVQVDSLTSLGELYENNGVQCVPETKTVGVQRYLELVTEVNHVGTVTDRISVKSMGVGDTPAVLPTCDEVTQYSVDANDFGCQNNIMLSIVDKFTETVRPTYRDALVGDGIAELQFKSKSVQQSPSVTDTSTQKGVVLRDSTVMCGPPSSSMRDSGIGESIAEIFHHDQCAQTTTNSTTHVSTQSDILKSRDQSTAYGCSYSDLKSTHAQCVPVTSEFTCGEGIAEVLTCDKSTSKSVTYNDVGISTVPKSTVETSVMCNIKNETKTCGVGDSCVDDVLCDKCLVPKQSVGVGAYTNNSMCSVDDKLCTCVKPSTLSVGVGEARVDVPEPCDRCDLRRTADVGVGDDRIDKLNCDICAYKRDYNNFASIGVGDSDVNDVPDCPKCVNNRTEDTFNFDLNILNSTRPLTPQQQAALCHYCGNKVDLNDSNLDESLQQMRDSMKSMKCGMKRSTASKNLNLDGPADGEKGGTGGGRNGSGTSDEDAVTPNEDDYEEENTSSRNDVIEACQMLHDHFSGHKPLKQASMMKYVGIIQSLWFKTVKRRRANASVVKSYIDLFQQRIPELLEMIVNLSDDEGNTALHYALTYKNLGVASILLDSNECAVDLVNQAGYSPVMLAALAGFEQKNDKYIMQRLFRLGAINKESADNGQTPLMLAVSRGNIGIIEILIDAGCDVNAVDDEGSTALMCACEHGNINIVKMLLAHPECDATIEDNEGSTALSIAMDARRKDLALLVYGSLNFDARGRIKLSPSKQSLLGIQATGLGRRSPSPVVGRR